MSQAWSPDNPYVRHGVSDPNKQVLAKYKHKAAQWEKGRQDRMNGLPCKETHGAYLEGWYSDVGTHS